MGLREALDKIVEIQKAMSISDPVSLEVKRVWKYVPPGNITLGDIPCWFNSWDMVETEWLPGNMREVDYSVNMSLAVADVSAGQDVGSDIATAFWEETLKAFRDDHMLGGTDRIQKLRGGGPTLITISFGGRSYVGLNLWLDIHVVESNT